MMAFTKETLCFSEHLLHENGKCKQWETQDANPDFLRELVDVLHSASSTHGTRKRTNSGHGHVDTVNDVFRIYDSFMHQLHHCNATTDSSRCSLKAWHQRHCFPHLNGAGVVPYCERCQNSPSTPEGLISFCDNNLETLEPLCESLSAVVEYNQQLSNGTVHPRYFSQKSSSFCCGARQRLMRADADLVGKSLSGNSDEVYSVKQINSAHSTVGSGFYLPHDKETVSDIHLDPPLPHFTTTGNYYRSSTWTSFPDQFRQMDRGPSLYATKSFAKLQSSRPVRRIRRNKSLPMTEKSTQTPSSLATYSSSVAKSPNMRLNVVAEDVRRVPSSATKNQSCTLIKDTHLQSVLTRDLLELENDSTRAFFIDLINDVFAPGEMDDKKPYPWFSKTAQKLLMLFVTLACLFFAMVV